MFEPISLAHFLDHYPEKPALLDHSGHLDTEVSPTAFLPLITQLGKDQILAREQSTSSFAPASPGVAASLLAGNSEEPVSLRLIDLERTTTLSNLSQSGNRMLLQSLKAVADNVEMEPSYLSLEPKSNVTPFALCQDHLLLCQLRGECQINIITDDIYYEKSDDGAGGFYLIENKTSFSLDSFELVPGKSIFLPAGKVFSVSSADAVSIQLAFRWTDQMQVNRIDAEKWMHRRKKPFASVRNIRVAANLERIARRLTSEHT